jgi:hypothetical protein
VAPRSLSIPDSRGPAASLRVTRHPEQNKVVLSHWRDGVCVASTPIDLTEVSALIGVLADALGDAIDLTGPSSETPSRGAQLLAELRAWLKPRLAQIVELRAPKDGAGRSGSTGSTAVTRRTDATMRMDATTRPDVYDITTRSDAIDTG